MTYIPHCPVAYYYYYYYKWKD